MIARLLPDWKEVVPVKNSRKKDFSDGDFRKASFSHGGRKQCVEVAIKPDKIGLRDSKDPKRIKTTLRFRPAEWRAFVSGVKAGEFDI